MGAACEEARALRLSNESVDEVESDRLTLHRSAHRKGPTPARVSGHQPVTVVVAAERAVERFALAANDHAPAHAGEHTLFGCNDPSAELRDRHNARRCAGEIQLGVENESTHPKGHVPYITVTIRLEARSAEG